MVTFYIAYYYQIVLGLDSIHSAILMLPSDSSISCFGDSRTNNKLYWTLHLRYYIWIFTLDFIVWIDVII